MLFITEKYCFHGLQLVQIVLQFEGQKLAADPRILSKKSVNSLSKGWVSIGKQMQLPGTFEVSPSPSPVRISTLLRFTLSHFYPALPYLTLLYSILTLLYIYLPPHLPLEFTFTFALNFFNHISTQFHTFKLSISVISVLRFSSNSSIHN